MAHILLIRFFGSLYSGSKKVHDFGACLLSYKTGGPDSRECIFLSRDAKLDGSKAVRGGIPLVFPQFGHPDKSMPQHGFLRTNFWKADESSAYDNEDGAGISYKLQLKDVKNSRGGVWGDDTEYDCSFSYNIKIGAKTITTCLEITNTGNKSFQFQTLLHTYYHVGGNDALDGSKCYVKGLEGTSEYLVCSKWAIVVVKRTATLSLSLNPSSKIVLDLCRLFSGRQSIW